MQQQKKEDQGTERTQTTKKMRGGWEDIRGNGNKRVWVSAILGMCCLFLHISTLMLLQRRRGSATQSSWSVERMCREWNTQLLFFPTPAASSARKVWMLNLHYWGSVLLLTWYFKNRCASGGLGNKMRKEIIHETYPRESRLLQF